MHSIPCACEANMMFGANGMPYLDVTDDGVLRRFIVIDMSKKMDMPVKSYRQFMRDYIENDEQCGNLLHTLSTVEHDPEYFENLSYLSQLYLMKLSPVFKANTDKYDTYVQFCRDKGQKPMNADNWLKVRGTLQRLGMLDVNKKVVPTQAGMFDEELPF